MNATERLGAVSAGVAPRPDQTASDPVFFINVRVHRSGGRYLTDRANWLRLRLFLGPFPRVTLVAVGTGRCGGDWLALPASVRVLEQRYEADGPGHPGLGRRLDAAAQILSIPFRYRRVVARAPLVGLLLAGDAVFYGGYIAATLARRAVLGIIIGSPAKSYRTRRGLGRSPGWGGAVKAALAGWFERGLVRRAATLFVAGRVLRDELGTGVVFSTSCLRGSEVGQPHDTCAGPSIRWLYVGAVNYEKGVDTLLQALALARAADPRHQAVLVGPVDPAFPLDTLIREHGLKDAVTVMGRQPPAVVAEQLAQADLFVFLSLHEGMPKAPLEAMARGVPVIATPTGAQNYLVDGVNGLLVPVADPASVTEAVARLVNDPELRRTISAAAVATARDLTYDREAERIAAVVRDRYAPFVDAVEAGWQAVSA